MAIDKINVVSDKRISRRTAELHGNTYQYLYGEPTGEPRHTVFLIHGWPDISMGWRYQIPVFLEKGCRVVCPDMMGYGGTVCYYLDEFFDQYELKSFEDCPEPLAEYSMKRAADDIKELARQLGASKIILGGHDWGGAIVYRVALWHPELVQYLFSVCTPFQAPTKGKFVTLDDMVKFLPSFGYQLQLRSGEVEKKIQSKEDLRMFLNGMYGGMGPNGELGFDPKTGIIFENLSKLRPSPLLSSQELDYYADEYSKNGLHGTLNWYRTRELNYNEEKTLNKTTIEIPTLFIQATNDTVLTPALSQGLEKHFANLVRKQVPAGHWALWQTAQQVNEILLEWVESVTSGAVKSSL